MYCKGAGAAAKYCTGAEGCVVWSTTPVRRGGDESRRVKWREGRVLRPERHSGGDEHTHREMKWFIRMFAVPSASAVVTANISARRLKRFVKKEDVGISSSRYRQGPKIVNTDGNARAVGQGDGEDGPANCLAGGLTRLMRQRRTHYFVQTSMPTHQ